MLSVAKMQRRNAWRYYVRGVAYGDGRRPVGRSLKDAQAVAGLPPGRWVGTYTGLDTDLVVEVLAGSGGHGTVTVVRIR
ncbi:hypothetical protein [Streptomyces anulatus]|uniref:hypothetical protein n=1 Tax=Streptomyces anulatus TaxID=1892 RepID=UPI0034173BCF